MPTKLCYFRNCKTLFDNATVTAVTTNNKEIVIHLDQTVFYPQGGGQPSDKGSLSCPSKGAFFDVIKVSKHPDLPEVDHIGVIKEGEICVGDLVEMQVDPDLRHLHNRIHTGGHLIDAAILALNVDGLLPLKAYHFPDGPNVEYSGELPSTSNLSKQDYIQLIQRTCNELIAQDLKVSFQFANDDPQDTTCERKMVIEGSVSIPCGGTHVESLKEIGSIIIRKIESKKGRTKISYQVSS